MMMESSCKKFAIEIVECARQRALPNGTLRGHLNTCARCHARWEDELELTADLQTVRETARLHRTSEARHHQILAEFDLVQQRAHRRPWKWAVAAAAALLLGLGLAELPRLTRHPAAIQHVAAIENADVDGAAADSDGFVDVPFAPPLAAGELVSVVRTELQPAALARMGISVDLGYGNDIAADLMVGEDGLPRAVRLVEAVEF